MRLIITGDVCSSIDEDVEDNEGTPCISIQDSIISTLLTNDGSKDEPFHPYYDFEAMRNSCDLGWVYYGLNIIEAKDTSELDISTNTICSTRSSTVPEFKVPEQNSMSSLKGKRSENMTTR